jgi:glycosyltransferase involved in cell wall biosynthesis
MMAMVRERADEFDVIHNHHDYWMFPLSEMVQTPFLTTLHGRTDLPCMAEVSSLFPKVKYVSISDAQRALLPVTWEKTVHHGIDVDDFDFVEKPKKYLAFLGRISPEKRPDWAIQIAKKSGIPLKIAAKIEGAAGESFFETQVKPQIDGKFIDFIGEISESEKSDFIGNAMALVFPVDWPEPFGLVALEALACGTPVLSRPCGAIPEILKDGETGFISKDISVLASRTRDLAKIDRRKCRRWVQERFSLKRMTEDYIHVYRRLARKGNGIDRHRWNLLHSVERSADGHT